MLKELIGAQIVSIDETSVKVKLNGEVHTLEIEANSGDCCGYADFTTNLLYTENSVRNPIITNIESESKDGTWAERETSVITFYGEEKALATIESEAGSGSGWMYGAVVSIRCKALDIDEDLASW